MDDSIEVLSLSRTNSTSSISIKSSSLTVENESDEELHESDNDDEETSFIESTIEVQTPRKSRRTGKGKHLSIPFAEENFYEKSKPKAYKKAMLARVTDPDNEIEPQSFQEAVNHCTHSKQ